MAIQPTWPRLFAISFLVLIFFPACKTDEPASDSHGCLVGPDEVASYLSTLPPDELERFWAEFGPIEETLEPEPPAVAHEPAPDNPQGSVVAHALRPQEPTQPSSILGDEPGEPTQPSSILGNEPEPPTPAGSDASVAINEGCPMTLNRLLLARAIEDREPAETQAPFEASSDYALYVYMDLNNRGGPDHQAVITWRHAATQHENTQTMDIGSSPNWRTWVRHRLGSRRAGSWVVEVAMEDGCVLGSLAFDAVAATEPSRLGTPTNF